MTRGEGKLGRDHLREKPILGAMPIFPREKPILGEKPNLREKPIPGPKPWAGPVNPPHSVAKRHRSDQNGIRKSLILDGAFHANPAADVCPAGVC
jgi:hypothetical protein